MKLVKRFAFAASTLALLLAAVAPAMAQLSPEPAQYFGKLRIDALTHNSTWAPGPVTDAVGDVYDNTTAAPVNFGITSADLASIFGDRVSTTGTGLLMENDFTIFNSATSPGPLLTATVLISFYDGTTSALLGAYTADLDFGTGLPPGYYAIVTLTNLGPANVVLGTQDVLLTQKVVALTGDVSHLGIVSLDPPSIGSSASSMYIDSSTIGPAGFYNLGSLIANPGYRINVSSVVPSQRESWGRVKALYR